MARRIFSTAIGAVFGAVSLLAAPSSPANPPGQVASQPAAAPVAPASNPPPSAASPPSAPLAVVPATKLVDDAVLPLKIPGYELRTLDRRKDVLFNVDGSWVRASVPVFVYFPTGSKSRIDGLAHLREVYQSLINLGRKPDWTAAELQAVIANLDASIRLLEQSP